MNDLGPDSPAMQRVRAAFLRVHVDRHDRLEELNLRLSSKRATSEDVREAEDILHKIAGAAGTLGLRELGDAARDVEILFLEAREAGFGDAGTLSRALEWFLNLSITHCDAA
ncbi:Hpt domain-containing protein [Pelagovum pacificum]|uniref:HPt domain-containing protein n=1 Tax=Pelagovum pacificum TaxID=2588711 RepID=A0A5C5GAZ2_9RHOB|nr:Hpt domain-containing protein [Pelagovum pacificum]QQA42032.1 Hpt domain-containing protein [Pelagovum pacificum]TNY31122.1 hypothetical protein FHY64_13890 [Pelagovum pacificum]